MEATTDERLMVLQFLRRHFVRIVIGAVMAVVVYGLLTVWMPYQREQRIAKEIESHGGAVDFEYVGPDWMPQSVKDSPLFWRIRHVELTDPVVSVKLLSELRSLSSLEELVLADTQVTDAGLEHLKGMTNLEWLCLDRTQVTAEGRKLLRKTLPNCQVLPYDE